MCVVSFTVQFFLVCGNGTFGLGCQLTCGNCAETKQCNHSTGACPLGCSAGYKGDRCMSEGKSSTNSLKCMFC